MVTHTLYGHTHFFVWSHTLYMVIHTLYGHTHFFVWSHTLYMVIHTLYGHTHFFVWSHTLYMVIHTLCGHTHFFVWSHTLYMVTHTDTGIYYMPVSVCHLMCHLHCVLCVNREGRSVTLSTWCASTPSLAAATMTSCNTSSFPGSSPTMRVR